MSLGVLQEAVLSVGQIEYAERFYVNVAGYEVVHRGRAHESQSAFWRLPVEPIDEVVLRCPGVDYGYLRLMKFYNLPQQYIRSGGSAWHTGGYYNLNVQVHDVYEKFAEMRETGWVAHSYPQENALPDLTIREVMLSGHDGVNILLVERVTPPPGRQFTDFSLVYGAVQIVSDYEASKRFYLEDLGFSLVMEQDMGQRHEGENPFNLPYNLAPQVVGQLAIFAPPTATHSTTQIIHLIGATGEDFSADAVPPNRGVMLMRYAVSNLVAYHAEITARGITVITPPRAVTIAPYGDVLAMALRTPDGAWMEFVEI